MIFSGIPRVRLLAERTPLERLRRIEALTGHDGLYAKRDDCMPIGMGGNKLRSLEFWLGEALARDSDVVLVAGKPVSNQCRLTAAAAAKLGLDCVILHNDEEPDRDEGNLLLNRLLGAELRFLGPVDEDARSVAMTAAADELRDQGRRPYIVGDPVLGALGYVLAAIELHQQAQEQGIDLSHVVLPGSMGPTEAGFLFGNALLGGSFTVHLVSVEYAVDEMLERIAAICEGIETRTGLRPSISPLGASRSYDAYLGAGYEQPTPEAIAAIRTFARHEGLLLETTYTSKPAEALLDLAGRGELPCDEPACLLHTGGLPALFAQSRHFEDLPKSA